MPPFKCYYVNCINTSKTHSMFKFPVKDLDRLQTWIKNSGNIHLSNLEIDRWKNRFLCIVHFDSASFSKCHVHTRILATAIPRPYKCEDETIANINLSPPASEVDSEDFTVLPYQKEYWRRESSSSQDSSQSNGEWYMPSLKKHKLNNNCMDVKCVETRKLLQASRKIFQKQNAQITWLSKKLFTNNLYQHKYPSEESEAMVHMQCHDRMAKWKEKEKHLSLALFHESPECYSFMLSEGIVLPDLATINSWLSETACYSLLPGVTEDGGSVKMIEEHEHDSGMSVKKEREEDSDASEEEREADFATNVKEESNEYCEASDKEEFEDNNESATAPGDLHAEYDIKSEVILGPE